MEIITIAESDKIVSTFLPENEGMVNIRIENMIIINEATKCFFLFTPVEYMDRRIIIDLLRVRLFYFTRLGLSPNQHHIQPGWSTLVIQAEHNVV
jgi:hypothetical protein